MGINKNIAVRNVPVSHGIVTGEGENDHGSAATSPTTTSYRSMACSILSTRRLFHSNVWILNYWSKLVILRCWILVGVVCPFSTAKHVYHHGLVITTALWFVCCCFATVLLVDTAL